MKLSYVWPYGWDDPETSTSTSTSTGGGTGCMEGYGG